MHFVFISDGLPLGESTERQSVARVHILYWWMPRFELYHLPQACMPYPTLCYDKKGPYRPNASLFCPFSAVPPGFFGPLFAPTVAAFLLSPVVLAAATALELEAVCNTERSMA